MNIDEIITELKYTKGIINLSELFSYEDFDDYMTIKIVDYFIMFYGIKCELGKKLIDLIQLDIVAHNSIKFFFEYLARYGINTLEAYLMLDGLMIFESDHNITNLTSTFVKIQRITIIDIHSAEYRIGKYNIFKYTDNNFVHSIGIDKRINLNKFPTNRFPPEFTDKLEYFPIFKGTLKDD